MSLLFPDRLHVLLRPARVQGLLVRGRAQALAATFDFPCGVESDLPWQDHLAHCAAMLEQTGVKHMRVVVGDAIARYQVLGWNTELRGRAEELAYARLGFDEVYGEGSSSDWSFAIGSGAPGEDRLVASLPRTLCDALQALCVQRAAVLDSLRPALVAALDGRSAGLPEAGWFISAQDDRLTYIYRDSGGCRHSGSVRLVDADIESQLRALERLACVHGISVLESPDDPPVVVVDPHAVSNAVAHAGARRVQLIGLPPVQQGRWRTLPSAGLDETQVRERFADLLVGVAG